MALHVVGDFSVEFTPHVVAARLGGEASGAEPSEVAQGKGVGAIVVRGGALRCSRGDGVEVDGLRGGQLGHQAATGAQKVAVSCVGKIKHK